MSFSQLVRRFSVGLLAVMSPGPDFVLTIRNSLVYPDEQASTRRLGSPWVIVHATYCLVGIGAIITRSILLFNVFKWWGSLPDRH